MEIVLIRVFFHHSVGKVIFPFSLKWHWTKKVKCQKYFDPIIDSLAAFYELMRNNQTSSHPAWKSAWRDFIYYGKTFVTVIFFCQLMGFFSISVANIYHFDQSQ